jgi:hypothetical protein
MVFRHCEERSDEAIQFLCHSRENGNPKKLKNYQDTANYKIKMDSRLRGNDEIHGFINCGLN